MTARSRHAKAATPEETSRYAEALARLLVPGDTVLLDGSIGAGKSHFARSAIQSLLTAYEDVPSPTYTIVQTYVGTTSEIWHADLYRLSDPSEIYELGLGAAFEDAICLVEWPDRLGSQRPAAALTLMLRPDDQGQSRDLVFSWSDARWDNKIEDVLSDRSTVA